MCIIFDADYLPPKGIVQNLVTAFLDPETGAVMGRVIPVNGNENFLTRLINIERSSGYQVDQQARYHLGLLPQYGGTVGGFRTDLIREFGGFDPLILAEDTDLTYKLFIRGWKVVYTNRCECHEEAVESWQIRGKQIQRWSRGHNGVMLHQFFTLLKSPYLNKIQKFEGALLLMVYFVPFLLLVSLPLSLTLCLIEAPELFSFAYFSLILMAYYGFGNFAPFFQSAAALILDRDYKKTSLLALSLTSFTFSVYYSAKGFVQAFFDFFSKKIPTWTKTERFRGNQ